MLSHDMRVNASRAYEKKLKSLMGEKEYRDWIMTIDYNFMLTWKAQEQKLLELMGEKEFKVFITELAKMFFLGEIMEMPAGPFRDFCMENFNAITDMEV